MVKDFNSWFKKGTEQEEWLNKCAEGRWKIEDGLVNVTGDFVCKKDPELTDFKGIKFGKVTGNFDCGNCLKLESLEGAPIELEGSFICNGCSSLKTLEGSPKEMPEGDFWCKNCTSLETLKGAPNSVRDFYADGCTSLTSLSFAPKHISKNFFARECTKLPVPQQEILKNPEEMKKWLDSHMDIDNYTNRMRGALANKKLKI